MEWSRVVSSLQLNTRRFTDRAIKALEVAGRQAVDRGHHVITAEHVLLALTRIDRGPGHAALERLGLDLGRDRDTIIALLADSPHGETGILSVISPEVAQLVDDAVAEARGLGHDYVGTEHLILALLLADQSAAAVFLRERGIGSDRLREAVRAVLSAR